jgi:hypothetical protein
MSALRAMALSVLAASGCSRHATSADCDKVMDHYVDMLVRESNPGIGGGELYARYQEARKRAGEEPSFVSCPKEITARDVECALAAVNVAELERCLE